MKAIYIFSIFMLAGFLAATIGLPASAAEFQDDDAGYSLTYDETSWFQDDIAFWLGDISEYDEMLVSDPLVLINENQEDAMLMIIASERDGYDFNILSFIDEMMGGLDVESIFESDDIFMDSSGDEFESMVTAIGVAPEFEDEAIFLTQTIFAGGKRYELCFLALPDNFIEAYHEAIGIMDSIDIG